MKTPDKPDNHGISVTMDFINVIHSYELGHGKIKTEMSSYDKALFVENMIMPCLSKTWKQEIGKRKQKL